ncbi:substrate-binding periplasmic protein [Aliiglaciecola sp. M165]|uniref:substrate-binding periplasmic protein n=1 Tax=Aliiglaciecola sp. M165 TaxID=2593649 RepID=UPI00163D5A2A|nr:transporter substrate-binding domain-containing protein [Aliiglaciecola sp. M165]
MDHGVDGKMRLSINSLLLISSCLLGISTATQSEERLTIYIEEFPPYNYTEGESKVGINTDIVRLICFASKIQCTFVSAPWNRAFQNTLNGVNTGLISTSRNDERENQFQWVGPLVFATTYLYKLSSRDDIHVSSLEEALKYSVGVPRNDIYEKVLIDKGFRKGHNLLGFSYKEDTDDVFFKGKLDLILASDITLPYQLHKSNHPSWSVEKVLQLPLPELKGNYLALNKNVDRSIVATLQSKLDELLTENRKQNIINKYIEQIK